MIDFSSGFVCVIVLLITYMFLSTLLINVIVFMHLSVTSKKFEQVAWRYRCYCDIP
jgi:hypothetical protein